MMRSLWLSLLLLVPFALSAQEARTLRAQAEAESNNPERVVQLLCKAADLEPKNAEYRRDCDNSRSAQINGDRTMLKRAQEALDAGKLPSAKRFAKFVSSLDPELHKQAEALLAKANGEEGSASPGTGPSTTSAAGSNQSALLTQALGAYESGNLPAAKTGAQSITEASLKPAASRLLTEIDRYSSLVGAAQKHEQAKEYAEAEKAYQSAMELNGHVAADDLAGKSQRMRQLASASPQNAQVAINKPPSKPGTPDAAQKGGKPAPEPTPDEKKRRLLDESAAAMSHNDSETAARKFRQVLDLDPNNADARQGLATLSAALNKDPVRLEKTLRDAIVAFYASRFEDAESGLNRYLGADSGKKKGVAYFYLGATEATLALLDDTGKRASRSRTAREDFKQARSAGYQPVERYVSARVLGVWQSSAM